MSLRDGLLGDWSYESAKTWLQVEAGVSTSNSALSAFYSRHCAPVLVETRRLAVMKAAEFSRAAKESPVDWDEVAMERLNQIFFELLLQPDVDAKTAKMFGDMLLKDKGLGHDARRLRLLEAKERKLEEAKKSLEERKASGGMSAETLAEIERTLGML